MQKAKKHLKVFQNDKPIQDQLLAFSTYGNGFFKETIEWYINVSLGLYKKRVSVNITEDHVEILDMDQDLIFTYPYSELPLGNELLDNVKTVLRVGK